MGQHHDLRQVHEHIQMLATGTEQLRREAILSLKKLEEHEWATAPDNIIQILAASLQEQLRSDLKQTALRREVVTIFGKMGPRAALVVPQLLELLQTTNSDANREAANLAGQIVRTLGTLGCADKPVRSALQGLWSSLQHSPAARVQVALALCKLRMDAPGLVKFLASTLLGNETAAVRKAAIEALVLCNIKDVDVVPALITSALKDKDEEIRQLAGAGLTQLELSPEQAMHLCAKQLQDSAYAEAALRQGGPLAVPALVGALVTEKASILEKAARTLGSLGEVAVSAVPALTRALQVRDLDVRLAVAKALWNITKDAQLVVPVLVELLAAKETSEVASETRRQYLQTVMEALRRIGLQAKAAIPALLIKSKDNNRLISESALTTIQAIGPVAVAKPALR